MPATEPEARSTSAPTTLRSVRVRHEIPDAERLVHELTIETAKLPAVAAGQSLIEVAAAGVNPSDVKATLGLMPHAVWPRTPGRDYAGIVRDGPAKLVGTEVWGSGGELGIARDGTHANFLVIDAAHVREKPRNISLSEAGGVGVPFITAYEGLSQAGGVENGDVVLVLGGNGKVGQAAVQLSTMAGGRVFAVEYEKQDYIGHATGPVDMIDASAVNLAEYVRAATDGHGADIVYNTVGSPYFEQAHKAMAIAGRQIFISTFERSVPFDIFLFYRGRHRFVGIDTLALDTGQCAAILDALKPGFEDGRLKPFPIQHDHAYPLEAAASAYRRVLAGARGRVILQP